MVGPDVLLPGLAPALPRATTNLVDATPEDPFGQMVAVFAGDLAGLASGAGRGIEEEEQGLAGDGLSWWLRTAWGECLPGTILLAPVGPPWGRRSPVQP